LQELNVADIALPPVAGGFLTPLSVIVDHGSFNDATITETCLPHAKAVRAAANYGLPATDETAYRATTFPNGVVKMVDENGYIFEERERILERTSKVRVRMPDGSMRLPSNGRTFEGYYHGMTTRPRFTEWVTFKDDMTTGAVYKLTHRSALSETRLTKTEYIGWKMPADGVEPGHREDGSLPPGKLFATLISFHIYFQGQSEFWMRLGRDWRGRGFHTDSNSDD
jgi:hypothetical protein